MQPCARARPLPPFVSVLVVLIRELKVNPFASESSDVFISSFRREYKRWYPASIRSWGDYNITANNNVFEPPCLAVRQVSLLLPCITSSVSATRNRPWGRRNIWMEDLKSLYFSVRCIVSGGFFWDFICSNICKIESRWTSKNMQHECVRISDWSLARSTL